MPITNSHLALGKDTICQCPQCKEFFSSTRNFDGHLKRDGRRVFCRHPETCGLEMKTTRTGETFWGRPWKGEKPLKQTFKGVGQ